MAVSHKIDGHVFFADQRPGVKTAKAAQPRGPRRNAPRVTVVAVDTSTAPETMNHVLVAETRSLIERHPVRQSCGSLRLLPVVSVDAAAFPDRRSRRNAPTDPWNDPLGTAMERRIRTGARRLAAA